MTNTDTRFPIGYVSRMTGLTTHVIRAWEKRYAAVSPFRSSGNRRLYTREDIRRLNLLKNAVSAGQTISNAAGMSNQELEALHARASGSLPRVERSEGNHQSSVDPDHHVEQCLSAVMSIDARQLDTSLRNAAIDLPRLSLMTDVIAVLFEQIGNLWADGTIKIIHEHMASAAAQGFLWNILRSSPTADACPRMVIATPAGQWCQIGALMAAVVASDAGWRAFYFGPNLPAEEIAAAVRQKKASCVALSIAFQGDKDFLRRELRFLRKYLSPEVHLAIGGRASAGIKEGMTDRSVRQISNLKEFIAALSRYPWKDG